MTFLKHIYLANLPTFCAIFNFCSIVFLLTACFFIKRGNKKLHIYFITVTLISSGFFLGSYLLNHFTSQYLRKFSGEGFIQLLYKVILFSHSMLAAIIIPLIFVTIKFALKDKTGKHKKIARITFFLWFYVSFSGISIHYLLYYY